MIQGPTTNAGKSSTSIFQTASAHLVANQLKRISIRVVGENRSCSQFSPPCPTPPCQALPPVMVHMNLLTVGLLVTFCGLSYMAFLMLLALRVAATPPDRRERVNPVALVWAEPMAAKSQTNWTQVEASHGTRSALRWLKRLNRCHRFTEKVAECGGVWASASMFLACIGDIFGSVALPAETIRIILNLANAGSKIQVPVPIMIIEPRLG